LSSKTTITCFSFVFRISTADLVIAGGGVAYLAHIGGFVVGLATGYIYKKTHTTDFMYGTRYGYRPDY